MTPALPLDPAPLRRRLVLPALAGAALLAVGASACAHPLLVLEFLVLALAFPCRAATLDAKDGRLVLRDGILGGEAIPLASVDRLRFAAGGRACRHDLVADLRDGTQRRLVAGLARSERLALAARVGAHAGRVAPLSPVPDGGAAADPRAGLVTAAGFLLTLHYAAAILISVSSLGPAPTAAFLHASYAAALLLAFVPLQSRRAPTLARAALIGGLFLAIAAVASMSDLGIRTSTSLPGFSYFSTLELGAKPAARKAANACDARWGGFDRASRMRLLHNLLNHRDEDIRWDIACTIRSRWGDEAIRRAFLTAVEDPDLHVSWAAAIQFAGNLRDREVEPFLALLRDTRGEIREKAVRVLETYRGPKRPLVVAAFRDAAAEEPPGPFKERMESAARLY